MLKRYITTFWLCMPFFLMGQNEEVFLFSYFMGNGEDGLHLAYSEDGYRWTALKGNKTFLSPMVGVDKLMRDPCIIKGGDDRFHMVWTVSWNEKGIGYAWSEDLIHWSEQKYIPVMEHEDSARNCWAPELFYDEVKNRYLIYWATTIPGRFPETEMSGDNAYNHRMYYTTTVDFTSFSETSLFFDQGFNVIDATIQKVGEEYVMFVKDETKIPEPEKNIRITRSSTLISGYEPVSDPITVDWVEGPTAIETDDGWVLYYDMYTKHRMSAVQSSDLIHWTDISNKIDFPEGTRHGSVLKVSRQILDQLLAE